MSLRLLTLVLPALFLAACDRQAEPEPQEKPAGTAEALTGEVDRSFAGELMPALLVRHPDGRELNLAALQGTPVLLNLWATWCAPCVIEMPMLDELASDYDGRLRVVTVSQDMQGGDKVVPFFEKREFLHLEPWLDPENQLGFSFEGGVLPLTVLYDASGQEVLRIAGGYDWSSAEARGLVDEVVEP